MTVGAWDVAFMPAVRPRHVLAFGFDGRECVWVVVDPCLRRTVIMAFDRERFDRWRAHLEDMAPDVWRMEVRSDLAPPLPAAWCVGEVKRLLGLRSCAFRPDGLRRDMRRAGAVQVVSRRESQSASRGSG